MPRQSEYRFSIDLPNGPACDVVRFRLFEALSQPFRLELDLASAQDNADPIALLDQPAIFTIARHGEPVRQVHGIVTAFDQGDTGFRRTRYQAVVEPSLVRLNLRHNSRIFQRNGVPDIIGTLLKEQRVLSRFDLPRAKHHLEREYCVQHREQDLQFFQRLAGEEGLVYYFDADEQSKLVLSDALFITAPSLARVANAPGTVTYQPNPGGDAGPCLWRFTYRQKMAFTHVTQRDYLFKNPPVRLETRSSAVDAVGHYEHYSYPGRYKDSNAGDRFTQTLTNALRNEATLAELEGDDARLWPGLGFVLDGRPNSSMQKDWRVASLHHEGEQSSSLEEESSGAEHGSRYRYTGTAVPGRADWKPEPCARPVMAGPQIAHVVGPPNEEIHTDEHGRVMVWFPWDREGPRENSSCWVRVSQGWAGPTYGMMAIPRIGHEVLVDFFDGDPDQPIIVGRTYHGTNRPPYPLPRHKTRSTWKSQTHKGKGSNEIRFEDEDGMQEVYIHAQRDQNNVVEHDETTKVGNDRTETVGQNESISIGQDRTEQVGRNEELSVGQDRRETVGQDHTLEVVRTRRMNVGQDLIDEVGNQRLQKTASNHIVDTGGHYTHAVQGRHEVEAGERIIRRTRQFELDSAQTTIFRAPGASLTIDDAGITLEGMSITIKGPIIFEKGHTVPGGGTAWGARKRIAVRGNLPEADGRHLSAHALPLPCRRGALMPALLEARAAADELKGWPQAYLLLETEYLEDMLRQQPDAPDRPSALQAIRKIAPCLPMRWQWEDTDYHVHKTAGPLLIHVPKDSRLIQRYLNEWCAHDVGLWLRSSAGLDEVHAHLRSLTWVELPAELPSRFRLQETSALQSVLQALTAERAGLLLGPIEQVLWRENAGPAFRWWRFDNASPSTGCTETTPWFSFTAWEVGDIDAGLSEYMLHWQTALTMTQDRSDHDTAQARVRGWLADGHAWGYARQKDLAALMDIFRHPEFPAQQQPLTRILTEDGPAPSARLRRCMDMLETPEEAPHEQS